MHSLLWQNMSPKGGGEPRGALAGVIDKDFGSFSALKAQLTAVCTTLQGSGWGALCWEPLGRRLVVEQVFDHQANVCQGALPIMVIDMWEHAYYLQYRNKKADWLDAYWQLVDWGDVSRRLLAAQELRADL
jgi:Fe-Mn family superoxide dismutase